MEWTKEEQRAIDYFSRFRTALFEYLLPHRESIGDAYSGIATKPKTLLIAFCEDGFFARLLNGWIGESLVIEKPFKYESSTLLPITLNTNQLKGCVFNVIIRCKAEYTSPDMFGEEDSQGNEQLYPMFRNDAPGLKLFGIVKDTAISHALPIMLTSSTRERKERGEINSREMIEIANSEFIPNFLFQWATNRAKILEGLDTNPKVEAYSLTEVILQQCGIISEPLGRKYSRAHLAIDQAIKCENSANEPAIHAVISDYPWILVDEADIDRFFSERPIQYCEEQIDEYGKPISTTHRFRPDFIYKLHDGDYLIVEVEAASKKLMIGTNETGFRLFTANANHALAQIRNYKAIITRYGNNDVCKDLGCPSTTNFRFLLVVGNNKQEKFDQRSWEHQVQQLASEGIELRYWDSYLKRLKRRKAAAYRQNEFNP